MVTDNFNANEIVSLFISLAKIEGLSRNEGDVSKFIKEFISPFNLRFFEDGANQIDGGNSGNLICEINGGGDFVLLSHMDTARSTKNLSPIIQNGILKSDGTTILGADNRAGITAILYALKKTFENGKPLRPFTIAFTICEETTLSGSKFLKLNDRIKMGFVFDSHLDPGNFIIKSPGALIFKIKIKGKASHAGINPEKGINTIEIASKAISKIKQGRIDEETTLNIGKIYGGEATNVVPELVILEGEIRSFTSSKVNTLILSVQNIFENEAKNAGAGIEFDFKWDFKPYQINPEWDVYKKIVNAITKSGLKPEEKISFGGSDANSLNEKGIPAVNIGIGAKNPHSNDEYILIKHLIEASKIAYQLMNYD
ncbi:MAG: M20/M25/M40 family metallo-hydrolase [Ignavibacteria bacterium]